MTDQKHLPLYLFLDSCRTAEQIRVITYLLQNYGTRRLPNFLTWHTEKKCGYTEVSDRKSMQIINIP